MSSVNQFQTLFTSGHAFEPERVHAVAIYCSDGRYGDHVDEFLHQHLGLPNYDRLAVPGGPAWLGLRSTASLTQYGLIREQLDFLVRFHVLKRAVLIAHFGCAYYLHRHTGDAESLVPIQVQDLREAAGAISNWFPTIRVELFLARADGEAVSFQGIPLR
jgi:hypothetical protein